jgi:hypothetical protein
VAVGHSKPLMTNLVKPSASDNRLQTPQATVLHRAIVSETAQRPPSLFSGDAVKHAHPAVTSSVGTVQTLVVASARNTENNRLTARPTLLSELGPRNVQLGFSSVASCTRTTAVQVNAALFGSTGAVQMNSPVPGGHQHSLSVDGAQNTLSRYVVAF